MRLGDPVCPSVGEMADGLSISEDEWNVMNWRGFGPIGVIQQCLAMVDKALELELDMQVHQLLAFFWILFLEC
jgi:hypothetical protein